MGGMNYSMPAPPNLLHVNLTERDRKPKKRGQAGKMEMQSKLGELEFELIFIFHWGQPLPLKLQAKFFDKNPPILHPSITRPELPSEI